MSVRAPSSRRLLIGLAAALLGLGCALAVLAGVHAEAAKAPAAAKAPPLPSFTRDTAWPKALPNNWVFGGADSVASDRHGNIWVLSRPAGVPAAELAAGKIAAPPVLELNKDGEFVRGWGGPQWVQPWFATAVPAAGLPDGHARRARHHGG